jgi:aminoglycoside/choline kinase family phosphotransferase
VYDLVALLNDSYLTLTEQIKDALIAQYADAFDIGQATLRYELDLVTVQRKLKDGGRFVFIDRIKNNPSFLPFVDISFERVKATLKRIPGHEPLKEVLEEVLLRSGRQAVP